jgi:glucosamine-6-phosphate isomerase
VVSCNMEIIVYNNYSQLSRATADLISDVIVMKPNAIICIASGHTPVGVFKCLVDDVAEGKLDLSEVTFVSLDEWIGVDPADPGSCLAMLKKDFFDNISLRPEQVRYFDITTSDLQKECDSMNDLIAAHGGLDVMLVGIGTNGHIGMNEPGSSFNDYAHISTLAEETISTGQKYFRKTTKLDKGITLGLRHFREARLPILMANGARKSAIMKAVMSSKPTESIPATIVHEVKQSRVLLDAEAAGSL